MLDLNVGHRVMTATPLAYTPGVTIDTHQRIKMPKVVAALRTDCDWTLKTVHCNAHERTDHRQLHLRITDAAHIDYSLIGDGHSSEVGSQAAKKVHSQVACITLIHSRGKRGMDGILGRCG